MQVSHAQHLGQRFFNFAAAFPAAAMVSNTPKTALPLPVMSAAAAPCYFSAAIAYPMGGRFSSLTGCITLASAGVKFVKFPASKAFAACA